MEELIVHESEQRRTRKQVLILSQTNEQEGATTPLSHRAVP